MNMGAAPKPPKVKGPAKEVSIEKSATALAKEDLKAKQGFLATALAGETGGYQGFGGTTSLR